MTPQTGQHVKIILRNGAMAEGTVLEWYANEVQLKSLDGESILIITHPTEDIMLIKVSVEQEKSEVEKIADRIRAKKVDPQTDLEQQFEIAHQATDPHDIDGVKSLAQLRIDLAKEERRIIAEKLKDHQPNMGPGKVQYGYPGLGKKPRTK